MDDELQKAYNGIMQSFVRYGNVTESEARQLLDASKLLEFDDEVGREMFFMEEMILSDTWIQPFGHPQKVTTTKNGAKHG